MSDCINSNKIQLWHCHNSRSLRALWALEELALEYDLHVLPFPPRVFDKSYLSINPLGTVPYFVDGQTKMTESSAICHYLVERYSKAEFTIASDNDAYGSYLNWLYHSDATLTFPQALYLRYTRFETPERLQPQVAEDYKKWYLARLRLLDAHLLEHQYLCDNRFTMADIAIAYALYLGEINGFSQEYSPQVTAYLERQKQRPAFVKSVAITANMNMQGIT